MKCPYCGLKFDFPEYLGRTMTFGHKENSESGYKMNVNHLGYTPACPYCGRSLNYDELEKTFYFGKDGKAYDSMEEAEKTWNPSTAPSTS